MNKYNLRVNGSNEIILTEFPSEDENSPVILIAPAAGVKQSFYYKFADFFSKNGYHVYTFDYEGIGESKPGSLKGFAVSASDWGEQDLHTMISYLKEKHPYNKLIVIGHSIGGQLIGLAPSNSLIDKIILIAAQTGYWRLWPPNKRIQMFLTWYFLIPVLTNIFGYFPGKKIRISEDLPKNVALEWAKWCRSSLYFFAYKKNASTTFKNVHGPVISYSFNDDTYAPKAAVDWLTGKYANAAITRLTIEPDEVKAKKIGHFGFFSSKNQDSLWKELRSRL